MSRSPRDVICDAGPLIHLDEIGCLDLLGDFGSVLAPDQVCEEMSRHRPVTLEHPGMGIQRVPMDISSDISFQTLPPEATLPQEVSLSEEDRQWLDELTRRIDGIKALSAQAVPEPAAAARPAKSARDYIRDGNSYYALGRYEEAIAAYERAIELGPNQVWLHSALGNVYRDQGRCEEAIAAYGRAIEIDPDNAWPQHNLGNVYNDMGRYEEALAAYERAIELDPACAGFHYGLGNAYRHLKRHGEALASYRRAVEFDPGFLLPHLGLAGVYRHLGNEGQSQHHLAEARRRVKSDDHCNLAYLESLAGDAEAALAHLEQALKKAPGWRHLARRDPDLDFIRDDARFRELVGEG